MSLLSQELGNIPGGRIKATVSDLTETVSQNSPIYLVRRWESNSKGRKVNTSPLYLPHLLLRWHKAAHLWKCCHGAPGWCHGVAGFSATVQLWVVDPCDRIRNKKDAVMSSCCCGCSVAHGPCVCIALSCFVGSLQVGGNEDQRCHSPSAHIPALQLGHPWHPCCCEM